MFFWLRTSSAIDPSSLNSLPEESLICSYFLAGFPHKDILQFLRTYITELAMCHLDRIFRKQKLFQKNKSVSSRETLNSVAKELRVWVFLWLQIYTSKNQNGSLSTNRELVRLAMKALDPEGVKNILLDSLRVESIHLQDLTICAHLWL